MLKWILGFLIGCCSIFILPAPLDLIWCLALLSASALLVFLPKLMLWRATRFNNKPDLRLETPTICLILLLFFSGFCAGLAWLSIHSQARLDSRISLTQPQEAIIEARIASIPAIYPQSMYFTAIIQNSEDENLNHKKLKLSWYQNQPLQETDLIWPKLGEVWRFKVRLKPIYSSLNDAGYDGEKQDFIQQIDARASVRSSGAMRLTAAASFSLSWVRQHLYQRLSRFEQAGILQALILGEKTQISEQQRQTIQALGISHLLAISGLHIAIIAGLTLWLASLIAARASFVQSRIAPLTFGLIMSCVAALLYSALAGFAIPTLRALIMWAAFALTLLSHNKQRLAFNLAMALLLILLWDPIAVLSTSFWLSFIAVFIIGLYVSGRVIKTSIWKSTIELQLFISFSMFLMGLLIFQEASLVAVLANLLLIPLFSFVLLPLIFIAVLFNLLGWSWILHKVDGFLSFAFSQTHFQHKDLLLEQFIPVWLWLILFVVLLISLMPLGKIKIMPIMALLLVSLFAWMYQNKTQEFKLVIFDVGHGLSALVYNPEYAILYDTGFANQFFSSAEFYLTPSLRRLGISQIDLLIISHNDMDHSGGVTALSKAFNVQELIRANSCQTGIKKQFANLQLEFVYANPKALKSNNQSCVVKVSTERKSLLLTGDIERKVELKIASSDYPYDLTADILLSPHHGSNTSSSYPFIKAVSPELVIHSTDRFNRYGMPHAKVKKRYQDLAVQQMMTGCSGQISINLATGKLQSVREKRRIWRNPPC
ncbi:DNA internalization-related competence protein ComEC/Rec2 [Kangiella sp. TOML190]|uniref:DNA internalization-related competence protein ComEC/Rec2 n=1 Tax=Kangiella sp. TOML190 TaxID=2931351 RepID=UPI0025596213|nr:DNA internalization-related competence protein ComEC/Rec2 [Kangiella sp. TOML190]